jgi:putative FmdB family regulatory protein
MPIFEYKCSDCETKFEVLHKSSANKDDVSCPKCNSTKNKKLFSSFSSTFNSYSNSTSAGCSTGQCQTPAANCSSGLCGLN